MIVLAIDLGETVGYAYVSTPINQFATGLLRYGTIHLGEELPVRIIPELVVIERPAYVEYRMQEAYANAVQGFRTRFKGRRVRVVRPADWMPRFNRHPLPGRGVLRTQHEKDAYRMAHWALDRFEGGE